MWQYIKRYLHFAVIAALFMVGEVLMDLLQPELMQRIVDEGVLGLYNAGAPDLSLIWSIGVRMIALVLIGGLCGSLNNVFVNYSSQNVGNEMRKDCFRRIMTFSPQQMDQFGTGALVTQMTNDITQVQNLVAQFIRGMIRTVLLTVGSIYFVFRLNPHFGYLLLGSFPLIVLCMALCLRKGSPLFSKLQSQLDSLNSILQEDISGIRIIKACVRETYEKIRFGKANDELLKTQFKVLVIFAFMNPFINALMYLVIALILRIGAYDVSQGVTTPGVIMATITYTTQLLHGVMMLIMLFQNISRGQASWKRIRRILHTEPQLRDGSFRDTTELAGEIRFEDVSFAYPGSDQLVLQHINLTIHPGETIAIMGETGCGKSTLVSLIPRFYDVSEGKILVDGVNVSDYPQKTLREKIAIVLQRTELFTETVRENIAWGRPGASDEDIRQVARIAQADDFISALPQGYQTPVAERGMSLSGGQKQRVSIARALLKNSEILIFDDSTSALDLKTESNLYQALNAYSPRSTKIIVAQRIASVRSADRIIVLEHGRIEACGSHEELLSASPTYKSIYDSQLGEEAIVHE